MDPASFLRPCNPNIVQEDFGDEMIVVNLEIGRYYTFNPSGGALWNEIGKGCSFRSLLETTLARHAGDPVQIEESLASFVRKLAEEPLIEVHADPAGNDGRSVTAIPPGNDRTPFIPPVFESYTDMQDLLMLDPIHEVDETGWPHPNPDGKPAAEE